MEPLSRLAKWFLEPALWPALFFFIPAKTRFLRRVRYSAFVIYLVLVLTPFASVVLSTLEQRYQKIPAPQGADAAVVLGGGGPWWEKENQFYRWSRGSDRLYQAFVLWKDRRVPKIVLTGHSGEVESQKKVLESWGVPSESILVDNQSRITMDHPKFLRAIFSDQNIKQFFLVTSAAHMPRAMKMFEDIPVVALPYPTDWSTDVNESRWFKVEQNIDSVKTFTHEIFGSVRDALLK